MNAVLPSPEYLLLERRENSIFSSFHTPSDIAGTPLEQPEVTEMTGRFDPSRPFVGLRAAAPCI
jgi:hypothetical protein